MLSRTMASTPIVPGPGTTASALRPRLREVLFTAAAALGVVCLLAALAAVALGIRPLVFRSGSMGPQIPTGALGLARDVPATDLRVGDVVSVVNARGVRITHRLVGVRDHSPGVVLTLRGDANPIDDPEPYVVLRADRLFFSVPGLGYVVSAVSSGPGVFAGGLLVGCLLMYAFGPRRSGDGPPTARTRVRSEPPRRASALAVVAVLGLGSQLAVPLPGLDTEAAFTDTAVATSGTLTSSSVGVPTLSCGTVNANSIQVNWTGVNGATGYVLTRTTSGGTSSSQPFAATVRTFTRTALTLGEQGSFRVQAVIDYGQTTWTSEPSNTVSYTFGLLVTPRCTVG